MYGFTFQRLPATGPHQSNFVERTRVDNVRHHLVLARVLCVC